MNRQEIFDRVAKHLLEQGKQSYCKETDMCMYLNPEGLKCAVGCLISYDNYSPDLEGKIIENPAVKKAVRASLRLSRISAQMEDFLGELQILHDSRRKSQRWSELLAHFAAEHGLTFNHP